MRRLSTPHVSALASALLVIGGCGSSSPSSSDGADATTETADATMTSDVVEAAIVDTGVDLGVDTGPTTLGTPSSTYPARKPSMPQIIDQGAPINAAPRLVTISWPDDPFAADYEKFDDAIGGSAFWTAAVGSYGVGPATSVAADHLRLTTTLPTSMSDNDIDTLVGTNTANPMSGWPAPTSNTLYVLYLPKTTSLTFSGKDVCTTGINAYHSNTYIGSTSTPVSYAVMVHCDYDHTVDSLTSAASHEFSEAATDPIPGTTLAYYGLDEAHAAWSLLQAGFGTEVGDMCEVYTAEAPYTDPSLGFRVQREWSNAAALAGHHPCQPDDGTAYFNVTPTSPEIIPAVTLPILYPFTNLAQVQGYTVKAGQTKTIEVVYYSDAPKEPWTLTAVEGGPFNNYWNDGNLTISIAGGLGQNGNTAEITVTASAVDAQIKGNLLVLISTDSNGVEHYMPLYLYGE